MIQTPYAPFNPCAVQTQPVYASAPQTQNPNYNAVKIDIHNPTVGTQPQAQCQPTAPVYTYPQAPIYTYPQAPGYPVAYPPVCPIPQQIPVPQVPVQPPVVDVPATEVPVATNPVPTTPAPVIIPPTVTTETPVAVQEPVVTQPVDKAPEAAPVAQTPEIVPADTVAPQVDLNAYIAKLANSDFEVQSSGMEDIAKLIKEAPEKATELVDSKIFDALTNIVNYDSSALEGPTAEQVAAREKVMKEEAVTDEEKTLANTITPKELAERNKSYALFTSALMQKLYGDEVARLTGTTVPLTELPGIMTTIDNLKDNPSPMVRASAIEALSFIQNPAYKKDLTTVFTIAQNDADQGVAESAKIALEKLNQI